MEIAPPPPTPKWPWITLLALQLLQVLSLVPWLMVAGLSFMAFDAPGSEERWQPWTFVLAIWSYPLWLLLADGIAWLLLLKARRRVAAVVLCGLVTLPVPALFLVLVLATRG